ncbi:MAG: GNAT family protein [Pseudomonadota bacterium]
MTLTLRKFQPRDMNELFSWFPTERDVLQWAGASLSWPIQKREFRALIRQHRGLDPLREIWAVCAPQDEMVGHFQLGFNRRLKTVGIGRIAIKPAVRGKGLSAALMALILDRAFARTWVHRVDLLVYSHNESAIKAYQKSGFVLEGTRRETTPIGQEVWDTHIMSLLRYEFDKRTERE